MNILIVRLSAIGDIIHSLPVLAAIKRHLPDAHVSWVAEQRSAEILRGNPMIDDLIEVNTRAFKGGRRIEDILIEMSRQARDIRRSKYDIAIDLQGLIKSAVATQVSAAKRRWGFDKNGMREPAGRIFYTDTVKIEPKIHVIRKNLALAAAAIGFDASVTIEFPISTEEQHRAEANELIAKTNGRKFAILNPAGGWVTKLWRAADFGKLADRLDNELGLTPIVVTGPNENDLADIVRANSGSERIIFAQPSLKGFYELAKAATVYVGGDTGPTHLAIAASAPVVGIFGPTEWWRNGSLDPEDLCVERTDIDCRIDCHRRTCSNWICMDIPVDAVFDAVRKRIDA
ncbi:MAG TPA: lipopolysaccharide heptosyltransferase I [Pyrinomonadaceae bacterium]|nr:lipopolysaccharide heptosyltransferase I [Pyrinomonadaceae bacterium]